VLATALTLRAHRDLIKANSDYAGLAKLTKRSLGSQLLTYAACQEGPVRDQLIANADVKRVAALRLERWKTFPDDAGVTGWALAGALYPNEARPMAEVILKHPAFDVEYSIRKKVAPLDGSSALEGYLRLRMAGKIAEANQQLVQANKQGIPLPQPAK
jgi:hypothetical protein